MYDMRILFINRMLSIERGGGETFDLEISRHIEKLGHEVSYLSGLPLLAGARTPIAHPRSHTLRSPYFGWFPWDKVRGGWRLRYLDFYLFQRAVVRWVRRHANGFTVLQVCELPEFVRWWKQAGGGIPVVIRLTAPNFYDPKGGVGMADARIASGMSLRELHQRGMTSVYDIPNCVDTDMFRPHPNDFRRQHKIGSREFVCVYVARFQAFKNHAMLLRAFARFAKDCPESRLILAGSGPLQPMVRAQALEAGLVERVIFLGEVAYSDLPAMYAAANMFTITSDYESFCFAALEAMATELPVVTTDCGWVPRLVQNGRGGLIVPVNDDEAFAVAMIRLAGNPALRAEQGRINRNYVETNYRWENSAKKMVAIYEQIARRDVEPDSRDR